MGQDKMETLVKLKFMSSLVAEISLKVFTLILMIPSNLMTSPPK